MGIFIYLLGIVILAGLRTKIAPDTFDMPAKRFEQMTAKILEKQGYRTKWTRGRFTKQHQIDIKAEKGYIFKNIYFVECKNWSRPVGIKEIRNLFAKMEDLGVRKGMFVTSSCFSTSAQKYAKKKNIKLINGKQFRFLARKYGLIDSKEILFLKTVMFLLVVTYPVYWLLFG